MQRVKHHAKHHMVPALTLFTSFGTLICCALPALFVTIGAGAALAGLVTNFPQLVWLSERKAWVFGISGFMLLIGGFLRWYSRNELCPTDKELAKTCSKTKKASGVVYVVSLLIYITGFFFAFIAPRIF